MTRIPASSASSASGRHVSSAREVALLAADRLRLAFRDGDGAAVPAVDLPAFAPTPGTLTAIRGASGSGKSTLLYVLAGLLPPDAGTVLLDGMDIYAMPEGRRDAWRRRRIGFIFQEFHLIPELSPLANVTLPATFDGSGHGSTARATALLEQLQVPTSRRSVEHLSRGERQRVAIARALLFDPPLIVADEPTASLDAAAAATVCDILRGLADSGKTVLVATHDARLVAVADIILSLDHGRATAAPSEGV